MRMLVKAVILTIPGGETKYQCPRCWGVYATREQAETINPYVVGQHPSHKCRAGPWRS